VTFEYILSWLGIAADATLLALLLHRRVYREFPFFVLYIAESLISASGMNFLYTHTSAGTYFRAYLWDMGTSSVLQFALLVELSWSVLKPIRSSLPRYTWLFLTLIIAFSGLLLWPLAGLAHPANTTAAWNFFFRLQQTIAILRIGFFLILASFSHLLAIGWRNRELQIVSGLGFYSLIYLTVNMMHAYLTAGLFYLRLDEAHTASYFGVLLFWVLSFGTRESVRKKFTPQMANFLIYIGVIAKSNRLLVTENSITTDRSKEH